MIKLEQIKPNFHRVFVNDFCFWFSYETIIAYRSPNGQVVCSRNKWSNTTGKHINEIEPDKSRRLEPAVFENAVDSLQVEFK